MEEKIIRFLELSVKFSKTENEAIGKEMEVLRRYNRIGWVTNSSSDTIYGSTYRTQDSGEAENETVEVLSERMVTRIKEYQEYKQLQKDLTDYYKAKQKLN